MSGNYIIEYIPIGGYVKVSAIDPFSGKEVSIVGDAAASKETLSNLAIKKLEYVLNKEAK